MQTAPLLIIIKLLKLLPDDRLFSVGKNGCSASHAIF